MSTTQQVVAIILARGGSKAIPRKNILKISGHPLLAWTILQVKAAGVSEVYVSTDDTEIARVATNYRAEVIDRPPEFATDTASSDEALVHAISSLSPADQAVVVMPQVTSPLRWPSHISSVINLVVSNDFDSAFSAVRIDDICVWALRNEPVAVTYDHQARVMRQGREPMVVENGSVYCARAGAIVASGNRLSGRIGVSLMPKWSIVEIDDPSDVELCEVLMEAFVQENTTSRDAGVRT